MKKLLIFALFSTILYSCTTTDEPVVADGLSKMDKMFINGFNLSLEQIYIMSNSSSIPIIDKPKDSLFTNNNSIIDIGFLAYSGISQTNLFPALSKGENWNVCKMTTVYDTTYIEHGYGDNYTLTAQIKKRVYNIINCYNQYRDRHFAIKIIIGNQYTERGHDNHSFMVMPIDSANNVSQSNLYMNVLTKDGNGLFGNEQYVYFDTNMMYKVTYQTSEPLTSVEAKNEIARGDYTLYLWNGLTTYKIGENLYVPRYGSYVYVGTTNTNGAIINLKSTYYRFKFRII